MVCYQGVFDGVLLSLKRGLRRLEHTVLEHVGFVMLLYSMLVSLHVCYCMLCRFMMGYQGVFDGVLLSLKRGLRRLKHTITCCFKGVTRVLQECYTEVTRK
jgi:hypothetical protein